jgi:hypothetical protein
LLLNSDRQDLAIFERVQIIMRNCSHVMPERPEKVSEWIISTFIQKKTLTLDALWNCQIDVFTCQ